jgi:hypothetical protein
MKKSFLTAVVLSSLLLCPQAQAQLSPLGVWTPIDAASGKPSAEVVDCVECCGLVVRRDAKNPDPPARRISSL